MKIGNKFKLTALLLSFYIYGLTEAQIMHVKNFDVFETTRLPILGNSFQTPDEEISVINSDELIIDKSSLYSYSKYNSSHHLVIFANKLIFSKKLRINLDGSFFNSNIDDPKIKDLVNKYGDSLLNIHSTQANKILEAYLTNPVEYNSYLKLMEINKNNPTAKGGNIIISARQIIFQDDGALWLESHGLGGGFIFVGVDSFAISSSIKLRVLESIQNILKNVLYSNLLNSTAKADFYSQIRGLLDGPVTFLYDENKFSDIVKIGQKYDSTTINKILSRLIFNYTEQLKSYLIHYNVNNAVLPFARFHVGNASMLDNAIVPLSDFMMQRIGAGAVLDDEGRLRPNLEARDSIDFFDYYNSFPLADYYSKWVIKYLKSIKQQLVKAKLKSNNTKELYRLVNKITVLPDFKVLPQYSDSYVNLLSELGSLKASVTLPLYTDKVSINKDYFHQDVAIYSEGNNKYLAEPTDIYFNSFNFNKNDYFIMLDYNPADPSEVFINFSGTLETNKLLLDEVRKKVEENGGELDGVFTKCTFTFKDLSGQGIINEHTKVEIRGNLINGRIACKTQYLDLLLTQFVRSPGLILTIHWQYKNSYDGDMNLPFLLTKVNAPQLKILSNKVIQNSSEFDMLIRYVNKNGNIYLLEQPKLVKAKSQINISELLAISDGDTLELVKDGIEVFYQTTQDFSDKAIKIIQTDQTNNMVYITNDLSPLRNDGSRLLILELKIRYLITNESSSEINLIRQLQTKPGEGYQISFPFFHLSSKIKIEVSGRAHYDNGYADLKPFTSETLNISIDDSKLNN